MTKRHGDAASPGPFAQEDESCDTANEPSSDADSRTLDSESEDDAQDAESIHDNPQDGKHDNLNDERRWRKPLLWTESSQLFVSHSREALHDEAKFRIDSAARIVGIDLKRRARRRDGSWSVGRAPTEYDPSSLAFWWYLETKSMALWDFKINNVRH